MKEKTIMFYSIDGEDVHTIPMERPKFLSKAIQMTAYEITEENKKYFEAYLSKSCCFKKIVFFNKAKKNVVIEKAVVEKIAKENLKNFCFLPQKEYESSADFIVLCN